MPECIICRKNKSEMSDEHVIPDSLGGFYHIYSVCKPCNSKLGGKVDSKLVNHTFSQFMRYIHNLKGKSSSIPNPFSGTYTLKDNPEKKVKVLLDEEKKPFTYLLSNTTYEKDKNGLIESFTVNIDKTDEHMLQDILNKISKRKRIPVGEITEGEITRSITQSPEVHGTMKIDLKDFRIGMLKIAYEFAVDSIPSYYETNSSKNISTALDENNLNTLNGNIFSGSGFEKEIKENFSFIINTTSKNHYLILSNIKGVGLVCMIFLYDLFNIGIKLSANENLLTNNWIIGVNDIEGKSFKKFPAEEAINFAYTKPKIRFEYNFYSLAEAHEFQILEQHPDFAFFSIDGKTPLFDINGVVVHDNISEVISIMAMKNLGKSKGNPKKELTYEVTFDTELYVKLLPSSKLYRVTAAKTERFLVNKL